MTPGRLVGESLRFHTRANVAVALGVAVGTAVLSGALLVGDSLKASLREQALAGLIWVDDALVAPRFFREKLPAELGVPAALAIEPYAPAIMVQASVTRAEEGADRPLTHVSHVTVIGVDGRFFACGDPPTSISVDVDQPFVILSPGLSAALNARPTDTVILHLGKPSEVPRESLLGHRGAGEVTDDVQLEVTSVGYIASLSLRPSPEPARNVLLPLAYLQKLLRKPGQINAAFTARASLPELHEALRQHLTLDDWGLVVRDPAGRAKDLFARLDKNHDGKLSRTEWNKKIAGAVEREMDRDHDGVLTEAEVADYYRTQHPYLSLESKQLILEPAAVEAALAAAKELSWQVAPTFVYLANGISDGKASIPYSIIAALDPALPAPLGPFLPPGVKALKDDEIVLADWKESPLRPKTGDAITLTYFRPEEGRLPEKPATFCFAGFVPLAGAALDPDLTPEFPGITDKLDIRTWDPPFPYHNERVKPADERYWDEYRTTPKAYVTLEAGRKLWASRYGDTTSIRVAPPAGADLAKAAEQFQKALLKHLDPEKGGFVFEPVRERALAASQGSVDFRWLFLGFSSFLIVSALLLVGLLFRLNLERRASEVGLLLATGYRQRTIRRLLVAEGAILAAVGGLVGVIAAMAYAAILLELLRAWWPGALDNSFLRLHIDRDALVSLAVGFAAAWFASVLTIWWAVRVLRRLPATALLAGVTPDAEGARRAAGRWPRIVLAGCALLAVASALAGRYATDHESQASAFFGSGFLLLAAALAGFWLWVRRDRRDVLDARSAARVARLGARNAGRNPTRSLLTAGVLAAAVFVVVAVESFHREPDADFDRKDAGSGGFRLIAETDVPVYQDLNDPDNRAELNFPPSADATLAGTAVYGLRLRAGDDVSCLNLYQPRTPRLLGVPGAFVRRGGFRFRESVARTPEEKANPWVLLDGDSREGVPAFADATTAQWVLGDKKLGDTIEVPDGNGKPTKLRLVGLLDDSIFQSELLVSEGNFLRLYPAEEGYRVFLVDAPANETAAVRSLLETTLADRGFQATPTAQRLAAYLAVENTYLATFQALGGLGLLLGACGLAVVLARAATERRGELALLRALGYRRSALRHLLLAENGFLLLFGVGAGLLAALVAVAPQIASGVGTVPWPRLSLLIGAVLAVGLGAGAAAVAATLRAPLIPALRKE